MTPTINKQKKFTEIDFYRYYFKLENVDKDRVAQISEQEGTVAAILCTKPAGHKLLLGSYATGASEKYTLAEELRAYYPNFKIPAIYSLLTTLKTKAVLVDNPDGLTMSLNPVLQQMRDIVKAQLKKGDFSLNYSTSITIEGSTGRSSQETVSQGNQYNTRTTTAT